MIALLVPAKQSLLRHDESSSSKGIRIRRVSISAMHWPSLTRLELGRASTR